MPNADAGYAKQCADAYYNAVYPALDQFNQGVNESAQLMVDNFGQVALVATNLALAIELYMKFVLLATNSEVPRSHDLLELYDALDEDSRRIIEDCYNSKMKEIEESKGNSNIAVMQIAHKSLGGWKDTESSNTENWDFSIRSVLERSRGDFCLWRYIYEQMPDEESLTPSVVVFEHSHMRNICGCFNAFANRLYELANEGCIGFKFAGKPEGDNNN